MNKQKVLNKRRKVVTMAKDVTASVDLEEGWLAKFLELPGDKLAKLLGGIANHGRITTSAIKKARTSLPSFSGVKWTTFVEQFGLPDSLEENPFERVVTPVYTLPPSVHEIMYEAAWRTQDVYGERQKQRIEAARARIMDPYLVRIIGLFQGRVIDKPMLETEYATGDEVEHWHEIFMIGGTLFFIAEFKLDLSLEDNVAQLFAEILAAAKANEKGDFANLRVYGLLTDLIDFHFYSYNPLSKQFALDATMVVNITRDVAFTDMIPVCNKIFGVILTAYIDGLEATKSKSIERKNKMDLSSPGSAPLQQLLKVSEPGPSQSYTRNSGRKSANCWELALQLAQQCRDRFNESVETVDDIERNSNAALELLAKR
ncbi:hypothetical protein M378DRAFT_80316 [Amanita muscaria Koide BX008]|uniref:Uncharacterized protein n=1 Tax=Amanita muscaria (strain Koide BX008) TaxID=946122 RepID=A0A0C2X1Q3_AMAMK|nr:hypothetical protein M378DRAFT_80316 [Amanita muscaria Koide BX008]